MRVQEKIKNRNQNRGPVYPDINARISQQVRLPTVTPPLSLQSLTALHHLVIKCIVDRFRRVENARRAVTRRRMQKLRERWTIRVEKTCSRIHTKSRTDKKKDEERFIDKLVNYTAANIRLNEIYPVRVPEINLLAPFPSRSNDALDHPSLRCSSRRFNFRPQHRREQYSSSACNNIVLPIISITMRFMISLHSHRVFDCGVSFELHSQVSGSSLPKI